MRKGSWLFLLLSIALLTGCVQPHTTYEQFTPKIHSKMLRVVTYNVNWGEGPWDMTNPMATIRAIQVINPDVIMLQETTQTWQVLMDRYLKGQFHYRIFHHFFQGGGIAFLSKYPILSKEIIPSKPGWYPAWLVEIRTPIGTIQFLNVHLVPTNSPHDTAGLKSISLLKASSIRRKEIHYFYHMLNRNQPTIIGGDFNEGDMGKAATYLRQQGFQDALAYVKPQIHTWRWKKGFMTFADRYDRVFYTPQLRVSNVQVLHEGESDHFPTVVDFYPRYYHKD